MYSTSMYSSTILFLMTTCKILKAYMNRRWFYWKNVPFQRKIFGWVVKKIIGWLKGYEYVTGHVQCWYAQLTILFNELHRKEFSLPFYIKHDFTDILRLVVQGMLGDKTISINLAVLWMITERSFALK